MSLTMLFRPGELGSQGRFRYRQEEFSLTYQRDAVETSRSPLRIRDYYVIVDSLTLVFRGSDSMLVSLDSYTNRARWTTSSDLFLPDIRERGCLILTGVPSGEEHVSIPTHPIYEFTDKNRCMRITVGEAEAEGYFEVATDLVVGLAEGQITELYLKNMILE